MDIDEYLSLEDKIARCRRIASMMTDEDVRRSLEELAAEYEAKLKPRAQGAGFMLQDRRARLRAARAGR